jgi:hypothetical protein
MWLLALVQGFNNVSKSAPLPWVFLLGHKMVVGAQRKFPSSYILYPKE